MKKEKDNGEKYLNIYMIFFTFLMYYMAKLDSCRSSLFLIQTARKINLYFSIWQIPTFTILVQLIAQLFREFEIAFWKFVYFYAKAE